MHAQNHMDNLQNFLSWTTSLLPANLRPSLGAASVEGLAPIEGPTNGQLPPVKNLDPFDCNILPNDTGSRDQCRALKMAYADTVNPDCSRLPPHYQQFCSALQPVPIPTSYNPGDWPNSAGEGPNLANARRRCAQTSIMPREFYACLWAKTKYPNYPEFQVPGGAVSGNDNDKLITRDNCPCKFCAPRAQIPGPGKVIQMWMP